MAGTIVVDRIESDSSYASSINVASKINFTSGMQIGGQDTTFGGMRNRIINGDMRIDQRKAGASYAQSTTVLYGLDRWKTDIDTGSGRWSVQQVSDAPTGFTKSLKVTITTQEAQPSSALHQIYQIIEGYNVADLAFGTANAATITVSFWVKASVTGTYSLNVASENYAYTTSYVVNSANTWEYKTVTIPGATAGTWTTENDVSMYLEFTIGGGTSQIRTANTWSSQSNTGIVSGSVYLPATSGATFQITGVQLEKGSAASAFEHRQYAQELALCQRYYTSITGGYIGAHAFSSNRVLSGIFFPVTMRATPTASTATNSVYYFTNGSAQISTAVGLSPALYGIVQIDCTVTAGAGSSGVISLAVPITLNAEL